MLKLKLFLVISFSELPSYCTVDGKQRIPKVIVDDLKLKKGNETAAHSFILDCENVSSEFYNLKTIKEVEEIQTNFEEDIKAQFFRMKWLFGEKLFSTETLRKHLYNSFKAQFPEYSNKQYDEMYVWSAINNFVMFFEQVLFFYFFLNK